MRDLFPARLSRLPRSKREALLESSLIFVLLLQLVGIILVALTR